MRIENLYISHILIYYSIIFIAFAYRRGYFVSGLMGKTKDKSQCLNKEPII